MSLIKINQRSANTLIGTNRDSRFDTVIAATGGTITTDGDFKVHTFTSSGNFVVSSVEGLGEVKILLVGGGGGGGYVAGGGGGGGGARRARLGGGLCRGVGTRRSRSRPEPAQAHHGGGRLDGGGGAPGDQAAARRLPRPRLCRDGGARPALQRPVRSAVSLWRRLPFKPARLHRPHALRGGPARGLAPARSRAARRAHPASRDSSDTSGRGGACLRRAGRPRPARGRETPPAARPDRRRGAARSCSEAERCSTRAPGAAA